MRKNKKKILAIFCSSFLVSGVVGFNTFPQLNETVFGTTIHIDGIVPAKTKTELIGESEIIIKGKVKELLPGKWSNPDGEKGPDVRNIIQTDIIIEIDKVFKGTPYNEETIKVRINKGNVGKTTLKSEGYPDFKPDEEVILFLSKDDGDLMDPKEDYYVLTGMTQGKFNLIKSSKNHSELNDSEKKFSNHVDDINLSELESEIPVQLEKYKTLPKPADPKENRP